MRPNPKFPADLVTFTEEIRNGKLYFLCCVRENNSRAKLVVGEKMRHQKLFVGQNFRKITWKTKLVKKQ